MSATHALPAQTRDPNALRPIGGFFARHEPDGLAHGPSVLETWIGGGCFTAFVNARSAFAALVAHFPEASVWLPAFLCGDLGQAVEPRRVRFYPVLEGFEPDLARVESEARPGDIVLVAAHFGLPIATRTREALARRPDLRVVEDRAQALGPGLGAGAGWRLYSPRKLLGVADGGVLVAHDRADLPPDPVAAPDSAALWTAPRLRADDPLGSRNTEWHAANQVKEAAMGIAAERMTDLSLSILSSTSLASLSGPRLANWRALDASLRPWSALPAAPAAPPLGYVLRLAPLTRDRVLRGLHAQRIFAAVHWPRIAAPPEDFPRETGWTRELLTLPCDHRYGADDMARVASAVEALL